MKLDKYLFFLLAISPLQMAFATKKCRSGLRAKTKRHPKLSGVLQKKDTYLWDNWILYNPSTREFLRYSLSAPTYVGNNAARHAHARIRVFSSKDGTTWKDRGLVVADSLTWSGQTYIGKNNKIYLFHTKSQLAENDIHQKIAIAESDNGVNFTPSHTLVDPQDPATRKALLEKDYYLDPVNDSISSFRDPYFYEDTLYFATRHKKPDGSIGVAIGRIRYPNANFSHKPERLTPMEIPLTPNIRELELPNVKQLPDGRYVLSVNLTDRRSSSATSLEVNSWVRFFVSTSPDGPWTPARGTQLDEDGNLFTPKDRIYGFNLATGTPGLLGSAFYRSGGLVPHALTPQIEINIE